MTTLHPILLRLAVLTFGVLLVSFLPVAIPGRKTNIYAGMTLEDLLDIAVQGPFLAFALWWVFRALASPSEASAGGGADRALPVEGGRRPFLLDLLVVSSLFLFFGGFGVHWAANSLHNAMDRFGERPGTFDLAYFYDEILGHKMTYLGFFGLLMAGCWLQLLAGPGELSRRQMALLALTGFAGGVGGGFSALEGQTPVEGLAFSGAAALGLVLLMRRRGEAWSRRPVVGYAVVTCVVVILFEALWLLRFGGLYQPSDLFKI